MNKNKEIQKNIFGVQGTLQNVIKGGYYVAPSGPAEPLVQTSTTWGTAMPPVVSAPIQQSQPLQVNEPQPVQSPASKHHRK